MGGEGGKGYCHSVRVSAQRLAQLQWSFIHVACIDFLCLGFGSEIASFHFERIWCFLSFFSFYFAYFYFYFIFCWVPSRASHVVVSWIGAVVHGIVREACVKRA